MVVGVVGRSQTYKSVVCVMSCPTGRCRFFFVLRVMSGGRGASNSSSDPVLEAARAGDEALFTALIKSGQGDPKAVDG